MNLSEWAKKEIKLATDKEDCGYATAVINSAAKAFLSLTEDGHSGMSIGMTRSILDRLIDCKPLSPLTGDDDEWSDIGDYEDGGYGVNYQNKRCSSVFKYIRPNGDIEYSDVNRFVCHNVHHGGRFHSGVIISRVEKIMPKIEMPYYPPSEPTIIFCEDFLVDINNGDFDHQGIFYMIDPSGERTDIDIFMKEVNGSFIDISKEEYMAARSPVLNHSALNDVQKQVDTLPSKKDISDGYHTFGELYYHRMMLFSIICNTYKDVAWKSWKHDDDTMFEGCFIVGVTLPNGDYSYHYKSEHWNEFNVKELEKAPVYDGHKPEDITRLKILVE